MIFCLMFVLKLLIEKGNTVFVFLLLLLIDSFFLIRGGVKKVVVLGCGQLGWGGGWLMPDRNFRSKNYHFLFLLPFEAEA